jgi:hypothetical protein
VCSLSCAACKAHARSYIVICGLSVSEKLFISHKRQDFLKHLLNAECVSTFYRKSV